MKTFKVRRKRNNTLEVFKGYDDGQARVVYTENFVMTKGERKTFNTTKRQQTKPTESTESNIQVEEQLNTSKRLWKEIKKKIKP